MTAAVAAEAAGAGGAAAGGAAAGRAAAGGAGAQTAGGGPATGLVPGAARRPAAGARGRRGARGAPGPAGQRGSSGSSSTGRSWFQKAGDVGQGAEQAIDSGIKEARGLRLTPPRRLTVNDGAGFLGGLLLYVLFLNYLRYGKDGVTGWLGAKFLNRPWYPLDDSGADASNYGRGDWDEDDDEDEVETT
ncbi:hypothetical protein [Nocardioides soli]|uniref:Uncharacterized protein n=1 Tax=Nocardioides soli TaxID=1036020 RepID=A0A7W4Z3J2_9ACTN|nr:hypothetical protein [Nocardioides soli]MBB3043921.1 hypothetical protein [Nocardioides soli]